MYDRLFDNITADKDLKKKIEQRLENETQSVKKKTSGKRFSAVAICAACIVIMSISAFAAMPMGKEVGSITDMNSIYWLIAVVVLAVLEILTYQLVSIWFAVGAVAGLLMCLAGEKPIAQLIAAIAVSIVMLAVTRPIVKKLTKGKREYTNADGLIGKTALVTEDIDNINAKGQVKVNGMYWTARSYDNKPIPAGEKPVIEKIDGVKLIVRKKADIN